MSEEQVLSEDEEQEKTKLYQLSALAVDTVGLVSRPAVDVFGDGNHFLFKSLKEADMSDEHQDDVVVEEVSTEKDDKSLIEEIKSGITYLVNRAKTEPEADTTEAGDEEEQATETEVEDTPEPEPAVEKSAELAALQVTQETLIKSLKDQFRAEVEKTRTEMKAEYEATITELRKEVQEAKDAATHEERLRKQQVYLEKAQALDNLPVPSTKLAEQLQKAEEADPELAEELYATWKAADAVIRTSQPWGEIGTSQTPEEVTLLEKVQKIAAEKGIPEDQAMLQLDEVDQRKLLAEMRGRGGRR
jgi:hypothetical protein